MIQVSPETVLTKGGRLRKTPLVVIRANIKDWRCIECGEPKERRELHVHHRDGNPKNNVLENLDLLCRKCHVTAHKIMGPSVIQRVQPLGDTKKKRAIDRFNVCYRTKGGISVFRGMARSGKTLDVIARRFSVTRERVRQWIILFGLKPSRKDNRRRGYNPEHLPKGGIYPIREGRSGFCYKNALNWRYWTPEFFEFKRQCFIRYITGYTVQPLLRCCQIEATRILQGLTPLTRQQAELLSRAVDYTVSADSLLAYCGEKN